MSVIFFSMFLLGRLAAACMNIKFKITVNEKKTVKTTVYRESISLAIARIASWQKEREIPVVSKWSIKVRSSVPYMGTPCRLALYTPQNWPPPPGWGHLDPPYPCRAASKQPANIILHISAFCSTKILFEFSFVIVGCKFSAPFYILMGKTYFSTSFSLLLLISYKKYALKLENYWQYYVVSYPPGLTRKLTPPTSTLSLPYPLQQDPVPMYGTVIKLTVQNIVCIQNP